MMTKEPKIYYHRVSEFSLLKLSSRYSKYSKYAIAVLRVTVYIFGNIDVETLNGQFLYIFMHINEFLRLKFPHKSYFITQQQK